MICPKINIYDANNHNLMQNTSLHKHILDLVRKKVSINAIKDHFKELFDLNLRREDIIKIIKKYSKKAKQKNRILDEYVCKQLFILEIDEIFKGKKYMLLVVVDKVTGYVYLIQSLPDRQHSTIINALKPLKHLFQKVEIVFTDGAPYYPDVVNIVFPNAVHFICLLHVLRNLNKLTFSKKKALKNLGKKYNNQHKKSEGICLKIEEKRKKKRLFQKKIGYYLQKRDIFRFRNGIRPYQKNIKGLFPEYDRYNNILNELRSKQRSITKTIENNKQQLIQSRIDEKSIRKSMGTSWNLFMQDKKLIKSLYDLYLLNGDDFKRRYHQLLDLCSESQPESVKRGIYNFLSQPASYNYHYNYEGRISIPRNYLNTNTVENRNSTIRYVLDSIKKVYESSEFEDYFELIRYFINLSAPYGGPYKGISPVERYGYDLKSRGALDILVEGLPPGKQTDINSPEIENRFPYWKCDQNLSIL